MFFLICFAILGIILTVFAWFTLPSGDPEKDAERWKGIKDPHYDR